MCLFIETFTFGFYLALCNLRPFRNCEILPKEHICGKVSCIISQVGDFSADKGCCPPLLWALRQIFTLQPLSWRRRRDKSNVGIYWKTFPRSQVLLTRAIRANLENFFRRGCYWTQIWSDKRNTNFFPIFTSFLCQQKGSKEFTVQENCNISDTMASAFKISSHSYSCQRSGKMQIWAD